jgi:hypothetical protein
MRCTAPPITWKIRSKKETVDRYERRHCGKRRFVCAKCSLVVKALEVFYDLVRRQRAAHVVGKCSNACGKEWRAPA